MHQKVVKVDVVKYNRVFRSVYENVVWVFISIMNITKDNINKMHYRVLEMFSGIGGMHQSFKRSHLPGCVVAAIDINTVANDVYSHNHPETLLLNNNIESLKPETLKKLNINMITMSPPCQPHTRVGHQKDIEDNRSQGFQYICEILPDCLGVQYVLLENVVGFETSKAHDQFIKALQNCGFYYREFILNPKRFGVPNSRNRYYCLARKSKDFQFEGSKMWHEMPDEYMSDKNIEVSSLEHILEANEQIPDTCYLPDKALSKGVLDIVVSTSTNTMCFTKAYTHYLEGTGSIYSSLSANGVKEVYERINKLKENEENSEKCLLLLRTLRLRYFTPREVARLMCFPEDFNFPTKTTNRQKYKLLGNSLNIMVVGEIMKLLLN